LEAGVVAAPKSKKAAGKKKRVDSDIEGPAPVPNKKLMMKKKTEPSSDVEIVNKDARPKPGSKRKT
jgi:hypothetical protein